MRRAKPPRHTILDLLAIQGFYASVFEGKEGFLLEVEKFSDAKERIHTAWETFHPSMTSDTQPPLTNKDKVAREDCLALKSEVYKPDAAKTALIDLANHSNETGSGVTYYWKQSKDDFKKVPECPAWNRMRSSASKARMCG